MPKTSANARFMARCPAPPVSDERAVDVEKHELMLQNVPPDASSGRDPTGDLQFVSRH